MLGFYLVLAATAAAAQSVAPSKDPLSLDMMRSELYMRLSGGPVRIPGQTQFSIVPLTTQSGLGKPPDMPMSMPNDGALRLINNANVARLTDKDIAYMGCDERIDNVDTQASSVFKQAGIIGPKAIVLFSLDASVCALRDVGNYTAIYTMISAMDSRSLYRLVNDFAGNNSTIVASISSNSTGASENGNGGPTTAVAMSILYSITGIITLLFLVIITTGAIRAHRHPERYGPRAGLGRSRQSRAKGLARAMLETLPIVKFGDPEPEKPGSRDVELNDQNSSGAGGTPANGHVNPSTTPPTPTTAAAAAADPADQPVAPTTNRNSDSASASETDLVCPICTDDFTAGEDVRVLPCNHKYHPACIDPWLLNVSGTCPLCRLDLRTLDKRSSAEGNTSPASSSSREGGGLAPPLAAVEGSSSPPSSSSTRRLSRYLDLHRLRHAPPDERIAALRQYRQQSQSDNDHTATAEDSESQTRRTTLATRLRDSFRIRTRVQNPGNSMQSLTPGRDL